MLRFNKEIVVERYRSRSLQWAGDWVRVVDKLYYAGVAAVAPVVRCWFMMGGGGGRSKPMKV